MSYEQDEFGKLLTVIAAAKQNHRDGGLRIETKGHDPSSSMTIEAYVLEQFLKPPKSE